MLDKNNIYLKKKKIFNGKLDFERLCRKMVRTSQRYTKGIPGRRIFFYETVSNQQ